MKKLTPQQLLQMPEVIEEINRHRWFESERAKHDIGFEKAAEDWITRFSQGWIEYYQKDKKCAAKEPEPTIASEEKKESAKSKKRSAKSYK